MVSIHTGKYVVKEKYIVNSGESPWWEISDPRERRNTRIRQQQRMQRKLHPRRAADIQKKYRENHPGAHAEELKKFKEEHPGYFAEADRRYKERHPGRKKEVAKRFLEAHPDYYNEFYKTPTGRATRARSNTRRRTHSTDPALYAARVYVLHDLHESCAKCGALYDTTHQIDHIIALCLGGTDDWDNLQPLCVFCHRRKSAGDLSKYKELLRKDPDRFVKV